MNKRDFLVGSVGAALASGAVAAPQAALDAPAASPSLRGRTQRLPDLIDAASAATFEAYVGERFAVQGQEATLVLARVERAAGSARVEQFTLRFDGPDSLVHDDILTLAHSTGQRIALRLDAGNAGWHAHLSLLA